MATTPPPSPAWCRKAAPPRIDLLSLPQGKRELAREAVLLAADEIEADLVMSAFEGALVLSRAARSSEPFWSTIEALISMVDCAG